jgi:hypothetical protein
MSFRCCEEMGYELTDFEPGLILKGNGFSNELRAGGRSCRE